MKHNNEETASNVWEDTRSGAWAGRGFHYQHMFSTLILVRQWAGLAPTGTLVPEGIEDCVVELPDRNVWIQIKSRESGTFSRGKVEEIFAEIGRKADRLIGENATHLAVGLEQPRTAVSEQGLGKLFDGEGNKVVVCKEPEEEIVHLLTKELGVADVIAEGLRSVLYELIAESAAANVSLPFERRRKISTTEADQRICEYLKANDPTAVEHAFNSGALKSIDFVTPVAEPGFYQGVKVKPGHVAAGFVLDRPNETRDIY